LPTADRDHGVNGHDSGEQRLGDRFANDDARGDFFHGIEIAGLNRTLAVNRISKGVNCTAEERFANRDGEKTSGGLDLVAFFEGGHITKDDASHFFLFEIERNADGATGELYHLVVHDIRQAIQLGHAIGDGSDGAGVLLHRLGGEFGDLLFNLLEDGAHGFV